MKKKMPKVLLTLAVACMLVIGAAAGSITTAYAEDTTVLPDDYIAYFTFDGTLADETGSYTATAIGKALTETDKTADDWTYVSGTVGEAIRINDTGDGVGLNTGVSIQSGESYSISFVVRATSFVFATPIVWIGEEDQSTNGEHWHGFWGGFGSDWTMAGFGSNDETNARIGITPDTYLNDVTGYNDVSFYWTVVTWTYDATDNSVNLYYDGELVGSATGVANLTDDAYIYIGANYWDSPVNMVIDDMYIYDRVLSADEVAVIAASDETEEKTTPEIESVEIVGDIACTEFLVGDNLELGDMDILVTYDNGTSESLTLKDGVSSLSNTDSFGKGFLYLIYQISEDNKTETLYLSDLDIYYTYIEEIESSGTYKVGFYSNIYSENRRVFTTDYEVTVRDLALSEIGNVTQLELNETAGASLKESETAWFSFTPTQEGYYKFETADNTDGLYLNYYSLNSDEKLIRLGYAYCLSSESDISLTCYMEKDVTYYFKVEELNNRAVDFKAVVSATKVVTGFEVGDLSQTELVQGVTAFDLTGTVITLKYSDGTTADIAIDGYSATDGENTVTYEIYRDEGFANIWHGSVFYDIPGEYAVTFNLSGSNNSSFSDSTKTITVVPIAEASSDDVAVVELLDEKVTLETTSEEMKYFAFTPKTSSTYCIVTDFMLATELEEGKTDASYIWFSVYRVGEDGKLTYVQRASDTAGNWLYDADGNELYNLTEGVTYYILVYYEGGYTMYVEEREGFYYDETMEAYITAVVQEVNHTHTYANAVIDWTWSEDHTSATAVLRCDTCSHTETVTATGEAITSVTTEATAATDGSIVYTATVTINGVVYVSEPVTVVIPATGEPAADPANPAADPADPAASPSSSSTPTTAPNTGDVSTVGYFAVLLCAAAAIAVIAKKKVNA